MDILDLDFLDFLEILDFLDFVKWADGRSDGIDRGAMRFEFGPDTASFRCWRCGPWRWRWRRSLVAVAAGMVFEEEEGAKRAMSCG